MGNNFFFENVEGMIMNMQQIAIAEAFDSGSEVIDGGLMLLV